MQMKFEPPVELLNSLFIYDGSTGAITNRVDRKGGKKAGTLSGCRRHDGYRVIRVEDKLLLGHRIAWAIHHGEWPKNDIDHINQDKSDNRIENLRLSDKSKNSMNRGIRKGNSSGAKNVSWNKTAKKWDARIKRDGVQICLGLFKSIDDAKDAVKIARETHHGEFVCHG